MTASPLSYVYDGRDCLGFILTRGKLGFEAFDREEVCSGSSRHRRRRPTPSPRRR